MHSFHSFPDTRSVAFCGAICGSERGVFVGWGSAHHLRVQLSVDAPKNGTPVHFMTLLKMKTTVEAESPGAFGLIDAAIYRQSLLPTFGMAKAAY